MFSTFKFSENRAPIQRFPTNVWKDFEYQSKFCNFVSDNTN